MAAEARVSAFSRNYLKIRPGASCRLPHFRTCDKNS